MATNNDLTRFWQFLETDFPPAGPRRCVVERLGTGLSAVLERSGLISYIDQAERYPCPHAGGPGCPRHIIHHTDGRITAVCGNNPPECEDVELAEKDIEVVGVSAVRLCEALRGPLLFGGKFEQVAGLNHAFRAGTYLPQPGVRQPVYFAARCSAWDYCALLDALRSRHGAEGFALLVPTDRFISEETIRESASRGIVVLPLTGIIDLDASEHLVATTDAEKLFAGIGRTGPGAVAATGTTFAQAFTRGGWRDLDEAAYHQLVQVADQYDIFADERTKEIRKKEHGKEVLKKKHRVGVRASYFQMIRKAIEKRDYFDPTIDGLTEDQVAGKQIFQRARSAFDVEYTGSVSKKAWSLFKTEIVDKHAVYHFQPDPEVEFALIFLPKT